MSGAIITTRMLHRELVWMLRSWLDDHFPESEVQDTWDESVISDELHGHVEFRGKKASIKCPIGDLARLGLGDFAQAHLKPAVLELVPWSQDLGLWAQFVEAA